MSKIDSIYLMILTKNRRVAVISAKNHKRQRRKRQSVTAKPEKSPTPIRTLAFATFLVWRLRTGACAVGACGFWRYRMPPKTGDLYRIYVKNRYLPTSKTGTTF